MASIDLKKEYKDQYTARVGKPALVTVPARPFLMIDGIGTPGKAREYTEAIEALYPLAYGIRAAIKKATGDGYTVLPLEGLWWADNMEAFRADRKDEWKWTMMIGLPDVATPEMAAEVLPEVVAKKALTAGDKVRLEMFEEGECAQVMHLGPYSEEAPTIDLLHEFIASSGLKPRGLHHEIYLGDPRKAAPEKLKTIIRQPIA
ncbi:MAG: hypothetical protein GY722_11250 [bacterium]|nr:hypothetical protein [bacterium]